MAFAAFPVLADEAGTSLTYAIPENGHVTIAINDAGGRRIRNLFADVEQNKGTHTAQWDGLDDAGQVVPPGEYRWVGLVRGSLHAVVSRPVQPRKSTLAVRKNRRLAGGPLLPQCRGELPGRHIYRIGCLGMGTWAGALRPRWARSCGGFAG